MKTILVLILILGAWVSGAQASDVKPDYASFKRQFDQGVTAPLSVLKGKWKFVLNVGDRDCIPLEKDSFNMEDMDGLKDEQGRDTYTLVFKEHTSSKTHKTVLTVNAHFLDGTEAFDQGPNLVQNVEPQFKLWALDNGAWANDAYFAVSCRIPQGSQDLILCLNAMNTNRADYEPKQCKDPKGIIQGYKKVSD